MKKLVRVSLFVLMALTLSLAIGCKHDSDPEPAKEGSRTPFVGTWVDESGDITCMIDADGTFVTHVTQAGEKYEGKYHVSPDGKTVTATINEVTFTLTSKSEDTLELTLPENLSGKKVTLTKKVNADPAPEQKPASANFVGDWKSTDGTTTVTVTSDGGFRTERTDMPQPFSGTYTVSPDGKTLTTSEITLPEEMGGSKVAFSMKLKDSETDVMDLPLSEIGMGDLVLVKTYSTTPDLTGTWTGQVVIEEGTLGDVTIVFADNTATLTLPGVNGAPTGPVTQNGNFFSITDTWSDEGGDLTGLISASGKAWLLDGSVFTRSK